MPRFSFEAKSLTGAGFEGRREARDKFELARSLRSEGFVLVKAEEEKPGFQIRLPFLSRRVPVAEKMLFARNLAVVISSGLSLARGLEFLSRETKHGYFKTVLEDLANSIRKGESFSEALEKYPKVFPGFFRAMIRAGEKTGRLDESLKLVSQQLKRDYDLRRRIRGAMMYPAIIVSAMIAIGILMLIYVVPTLTSTFEELGVPLPATTQAVVFISTILTRYALFVPFFVIVAIGLAVWAFQSQTGRRITDAVILKSPVISGLAKKTYTARTCRTLGSLLGAGVEILEALKITEDVLQNHYYKDVLVEARKEVEKGGPISKLFIGNPHLYPSLVGEMISVGEETGKLSEMLFRLAIFYENDVTQSTKDLSTIIEPVLMVIIGTVVGFFAISMLQPLYNIVGSF